MPDYAEFKQIVSHYLQFQGDRKTVELAFFGGNFLGLDSGTFIRMLDWTMPYLHQNKIDSIRFSTRPDTITQKTLDQIRPYPVSAIELGVQSMNDAVLAESKRGHTAEDTVQAISLLKQYHFSVGVQMMIGLPKDTEKTLMKSTESVAGLGPDFARIYPLLVLEDSLIARWFRQGKYTPLDLETSIYLAKEMINIFNKRHVKVTRVGLQASDSIGNKQRVLAGPWHPAFGHLVFSALMFDHVCERIDSYIKSSLTTQVNEIVILVHPRSESRVRGDKGKQFEEIKNKFNSRSIRIQQDPTVPMGEVRIVGR